MKQFPSNLKYKKYHKMNYFFAKSSEKRMYLPLQGTKAIQSIEAGKFTYRQMEACRRTIRRGTGKKVPIHIKIFPSVPRTRKPVAVRMGKGKGPIKE
jgi:large subunit ribosomal protein L16